jgi:UTP--glucose-1-phosphate uridylyltransferase
MHTDRSRSKLEQNFLPYPKKMADEGIPLLIIDNFKLYYEKLLNGERGLISREEIVPVGKDDIPALETLGGYAKAGRRALKDAVIIKLNGGLGTSMGLSKAKSLLEVKDGYNFLDIIAKQVLSLREVHGEDIPLVLMNSFNTDEDSTTYLERYPELASDIPFSFLQHKFPKVLQEGLSPAEWPTEPDLEWNPPGHGDIYLALLTSGMLDKLLAKGCKYAFISNSDNLGGTMDMAALGYFASHDFPFMMEVAEKTKTDIKGGHIARLRRTGSFILREIAQCPEEEIEEFQDINIYRYFNTNNLWLNLVFLKGKLEKTHNGLNLPFIVNPKKIDPKDDSSPQVYQIETAMGSAISVFEGAAAVQVPRQRFIPVKRCRDLLALWSDCYVMTEDGKIILNPGRRLGPIEIVLDDRFFKRIDQLKKRFPYGAPSLIHCQSLRVEGNVYFGKGIVIKGDVGILSASSSKVSIPGGTVLNKDLLFNENLP